jgi:D-3-phosphoglycerate dehydrogenase
MTTRPWFVLTEPLDKPFDATRASELPVIHATGGILHVANSLEEWQAMAAEADAVLHWRVPVDEREIARLHRCRIIAHYGVGVDRIDVAAAARVGIYVANVPRYGVDEVADHAMTLLLAAARKLRALEQVVRDGDWGVQAVRPIGRLRGRTLGILGLGNIGSAVATRALGFGLNVVACDPFVSDDRFKQSGARRGEFSDALAESDFLSLHVPLTQETRGMIDGAAFGRMKRGIIVVNTSRGAVVDEEALARAVKDGIVAAAALDVFAQEPLPVDSPLRVDERIILTPHAAFFSEESIVDMQIGACQQVSEAFAKRRPSAVVALPGVDWTAADHRWRPDEA